MGLTDSREEELCVGEASQPSQELLGGFAMGCVLGKAEVGLTDSRQEELYTGEPSQRGEVLRGYTLGCLLGKGSCGHVYSARHLCTGREVSVKVADRSKMLQQLFEHEARMLKMLQHPRVVHLHEALAMPDLWVFVMDIYRGGSVETVVQAHWAAKGRLALPVVQNLTRMMVEATAWLHEKKIAHRDLKQANFLADRSDVTDPEIKVVLCDVAMATFVREGQRKDRQVGTPIYWAPEVWEKSYGLAADIWALGVTTYALSLQAWPFKGQEETCQQPLRWDICDLWSDDANEMAFRFVCGMLWKREADRFTATTALEHEFLAPGAAADALSSTLATDVADDKSADTPSTTFSDTASTDVSSREGSLQASATASTDLGRFSQRYDAEVTVPGMNFAAQPTHPPKSSALA